MAKKFQHGGNRRRGSKNGDSTSGQQPKQENEASVSGRDNQGTAQENGHSAHSTQSQPDCKLLRLNYIISMAIKFVLFNLALFSFTYLFFQEVPVRLLLFINFLSVKFILQLWQETEDDDWKTDGDNNNNPNPDGENDQPSESTESQAEHKIPWPKVFLSFAIFILAIGGIICCAFYPKAPLMVKVFGISMCNLLCAVFKWQVDPYFKKP